MVDHSATIAAVEIDGDCFIGEGCQPASARQDAGPTAPCDAVTIFGYSACTVTFVSTAGLRVAVPVSVQPVSGGAHSCDDFGMVREETFLQFQTPVVDVDFAQRQNGTTDGATVGGDRSP